MKRLLTIFFTLALVSCAHAKVPADTGQAMVAQVACTGTKAATRPVGPDQVPTQAMWLKPGMRCVLPVHLTNKGPLSVRVSTVLLPLMGTRGGAAVQVKQVGHAVRQGDDIDGHYRIDRSLAPGDRMTLNVVFVIRKGGCTDRGPTWVERFPQVGVRALGIGSTVAATDAIAFQGTAASTCSD